MRDLTEEQFGNMSNVDLALLHFGIEHLDEDESHFLPESKQRIKELRRLSGAEYRRRKLDWRMFVEDL